FFCFFFQAEDGIRDRTVTGVQTCALPIYAKILGIINKNPVYVKAEKDFAGLFVDDSEDFRIQPCFSPVWDTAINIIALAESGASPEHPALQKAAEWLVKKEVRMRGDWTVNNPHRESSGWASEY